MNHVLFRGSMWAIQRLKWPTITASAIELFHRKLLAAKSAPATLWKAHRNGVVLFVLILSGLAECL